MHNHRTSPQQPQGVRLARTRLNLYKAIRYATRTCEMEPRSAACRVAWDHVEELNVAVQRLRRLERHNQTVQEHVCDVDPGHPECRMYDV